MRIINRDYGLGYYNSNSNSHNNSTNDNDDQMNKKCPLQIEAAVKVSFRHGLWFDVCSGNEMRIPLQHYEFHEVRR